MVGPSMAQLLFLALVIFELGSFSLLHNFMVIDLVFPYDDTLHMVGKSPLLCLYNSRI